MSFGGLNIWDLEKDAYADGILSVSPPTTVPCPRCSVRKASCPKNQGFSKKKKECSIFTFICLHVQGGMQLPGNLGQFSWPAQESKIHLVLFVMWWFGVPLMEGATEAWKKLIFLSAGDA